MPRKAKGPLDFVDPREKALKAIFRRLDRDPLLDPKTRYRICLIAAGHFVAKNLPPEAAPPVIAEAPNIIASAAAHAAVRNPATMQHNALLAVSKEVAN